MRGNLNQVTSQDLPGRCVPLTTSGSPPEGLRRSRAAGLQGPGCGGAWPTSSSAQLSAPENCTNLHLTDGLPLLVRASSTLCRFWKASSCFPQVWCSCTKYPQCPGIRLDTWRAYSLWLMAIPVDLRVGNPFYFSWVNIQWNSWAIYYMCFSQPDTL